MPDLRAADHTSLAALFAAHGGVVSAAPVTVLPGVRSGRASYRVRLRDGVAVKLRRCADAATAARVAPVLARAGAWVVEPWVAGAPVPAAAGTATLLACGRLLGGLHGGATAAVPLPAAHSARAAARLRRLGRAGLLPAATVEVLGWSLANERPATVEVGPVHGDFAADNLVLAADGPVSIDNETRDRAALDYDLGRLLWRWPLPPDGFAALLEGYGAHRAPDGFLDGFRYWLTRALVDSAWFRLHAATPGADRPRARLHHLAETTRNTDSPDWKNYLWR